jgi:hypothetical protein
MSRRFIQCSVTSATHPTGDLQEYSTAEDAVLYADELIRDGFSPQIRISRAGVWEDVSFEDLIALALE